MWLADENWIIANWSWLMDVLGVLLIPVGIFVLGTWWPAQQVEHRRMTFIRLIYKEISEITPSTTPEAGPREHPRWPQYLKKRFVHEEIFNRPTENRDFLLSLPPFLMYHVAQLWTTFGKAKEAAQEEPGQKRTKERLDQDLAEYGCAFLYHLDKICALLEENKKYADPSDLLGPVFKGVKWRYESKTT